MWLPTATREAPFGRLQIAFNEPVEPTSVTGNSDGAPGSVSVRIGATKQFGSLYSDPVDGRRSTGRRWPRSRARPPSSWT